MQHELTIKLEVRDGSSINQAENLDEEELQYSRKMNELRNLKEMKSSQMDLIRDMQETSGSTNEK